MPSDEPRRTTVVIVDGEVDLVSIELVSGRPDLALVNSIARLGLAARRLGCSVDIRHPCPELMPLLHLVGLADVFLADVLAAGPEPVDPAEQAEPGSALEAVGQAEDGEEVGVEEVVVPRDPPL